MQYLIVFRKRRTKISRASRADIICRGIGTKEKHILYGKLDKIERNITKKIHETALNIMNLMSLLNFQYTLWVGTNVTEVFSLTLVSPKNTTFFRAMTQAADIDPRFAFEAREWPNGHYVHTLGLFNISSQFRPFDRNI